MKFKLNYLSIDELRVDAEAQGLDVDQHFRGIYDQDGMLVGTFSVSSIGEVTNVRILP